MHTLNETKKVIKNLFSFHGVSLIKLNDGGTFGWIVQVERDSNALLISKKGLK